MKARKGYRTCVRCNRNRALRFFANRGTVCTPCQRASAAYRSKDLRLRETYGITMEDYEHILAMQGGVCAICKGRRAVLDVDHDHAREKALIESGVEPLLAARLSVRGLVCKRENRRGLPAFQDDPVHLQSAIDYLTEPPAWLVLHYGGQWNVFQ